ncbi:MAG: SPFH/Band 7/PHB domain protein [Armatimonadetes bacterium]|nr:SPFH/Band 7/PHB domain protein [Armatimonadota bacterium]
MEYLLFILVLLLVVVVAKSARIILPYEKGVVERLGQYLHTADPGLCIIWPFLDYLRKVDMREKVIDVPPQEVITEDNVVVTVDAIIYYQVTDPVRVIYQVQDFQLATMKLAQTNLRNVVGDLELDETLTSRERINAELRKILDEATDNWGVRITRVEIQKIDPPRDITEAMSQQMKAERERRAAILEAEGVKQSAILRAEGQKQSAILAAEGEAEATRRVAEAQAYRQQTLAVGEGQAIKTVFTAIHEGGATEDVLAIRYLETLGKIADGKATKIFLPVETSSVLSSVAALAEAFRGDGAPAAPTATPTAAPPVAARPATSARPTARAAPKADGGVDTTGLR